MIYTQPAQAVFFRERYSRGTVPLTRHSISHTKRIAGAPLFPGSARFVLGLCHLRDRYHCPDGSPRCPGWERGVQAVRLRRSCAGSHRLMPLWAWAAQVLPARQRQEMPASCHQAYRWQRARCPRCLSPASRCCLSFGHRCQFQTASQWTASAPRPGCQAFRHGPQPRHHWKSAFRSCSRRFSGPL